MNQEDTKKIKRGLRLMRMGYSMLADAYDTPDMMTFEFPIDYEKMNELMRVIKEDLRDV